MNALLLRLGPPLRALRGVMGNRPMRRAELAFTLFSMAEVGTWVAILVYAFNVGGTAGTGLAGLVLLVPAGLVAPMSAALGDRYRRERVVTFGYAAQAVSVAVTGVAIVVGFPVAAVYTLAAVAMMAFTTGRPGHHALLPSLATTPDELTAGNSVSSLGEGVGGILGGIAVAVLVANGGVGVVYLGMAGVLVLATALAAGIRGEPPATPGARVGPWTLASDAIGAIGAIARTSGPRLLVAVAGVTTLAFGMFDVLMVSLALGRLGMGDSGVGSLSVALSVGSFVGAAASVALVGRRRLAPGIFIGAAILGAGFAILGLADTVIVAGAGVVLAGSAISLLDVTGRTLLQRVVDDGLLTRVFGAIEAFWMLGVGVGAALAPAVEHALGLTGALVTTGMLLPALVLVWSRGLRRLDAAAVLPERQLALLDRIPMFAPLPRPDLERVARQLDRIAVRAGDVVIQQGDVGDRFYVVDEGRFEVAADGRLVNELHEGDHFGEIALLHDVPRTATVRAAVDGVVWALDQEEFLATVTGLPQVASAAHAISAERLRSLGTDRS